MKLSTITPYWDRPEVLRLWLSNLQGVDYPEVKHIVIFVGEGIPDWVEKEYGREPKFHFVQRQEDKPGFLSIGHYHNLGAKLACAEWIMKLDVDTLPNVRYFKELLPLLERAQPRQWFNGGMVYLNRTISSNLSVPLDEETYRMVMGNRRIHLDKSYFDPAATNFICRREDYLNLGGCDGRFRGWGWEDYQQIYQLERYQRGDEPLPGVIDFTNVTRRCRDEISRPKALELWKANSWLCLFHCWHPKGNSFYRNTAVTANNRKILLDCILKARKG